MIQVLPQYLNFVQTPLEYENCFYSLSEWARNVSGSPSGGQVKVSLSPFYLLIYTRFDDLVKSQVISLYLFTLTHFYCQISGD
jgi:hypothetical protein